MTFCNYETHNRCIRCEENHPKEIGVKCPECHYKMRTVPHFYRGDVRVVKRM